MKALILLILLMSYSLIGKCQLINCNPDSTGSPWYAGGLSIATPSVQDQIDSISEFTLSSYCDSVELDYMVDNSTNLFMPEIIYQGLQGICAQAALISYMFTYEINRSRNISSTHSSNKYHPSFNYNFLNYGTPDSGTFIHHGLEILKEFGCPDSATYDRPIPNPDYTEWMSGNAKYLASLKNRISGYEKINILSDSGIIHLKYWIQNHNSSDTVGGLSVFGVLNFLGLSYDLIPEGHCEGEEIVTSFSSFDTSAHALTIVGFNDSIRYDYNSDSVYDEWEYGAFKIANTHGIAYPPILGGGYVHIPYFMLQDSSFLLEKNAYICYAIEEYKPEIIIRTKMTHPNREYFKAMLGFDTIAGNSNLAFRKPVIRTLSIYNSGESKLPGLNAINDTLEICLDFTHQYSKFDYKNIGKVFFRPYSLSSYADSGMLWYGSMIDYRWNDSLLLKLRNIPDTMEYSEEWKFSVDYDLLPFSISNDTSVNTNQIFRLNDTIKEGALLKIGNVRPTELHLQNTG